MRLKRWMTIMGGAAAGLVFATWVAAAPLPQREAEHDRPPPHEGDSFHAAPHGPAPTFAFVSERGIAEVPVLPTRLPAPLRRGQTESVVAAVPAGVVFPLEAGLSLPMGAALIGVLGLAVQGNRPRKI